MKAFQNCEAKSSEQTSLKILIYFYMTNCFLPDFYFALIQLYFLLDCRFLGDQLRPLDVAPFLERSWRGLESRHQSIHNKNRTQKKTQPD